MKQRGASWVEQGSMRYRIRAASSSNTGVVVFAVLIALSLGQGLKEWQAAEEGEPSMVTLSSLAEASLRERPVEFSNGEVHFAGVLTLPTGEGPFPAIFLLTGSGAQDRDGEMFGHKRHKILAETLSRAGFAVLRVDDRGVGDSTGHLALATNADLASDGWAGVRFLRQQPEIDPQRIGLYGPSQGSLIAPMVAVEHPEVAFVVLVAAIGQPMGEVFVAQHTARVRAMGLPEATVQQVDTLARQVVGVVLSDAVDEERKKHLTRLAQELDRLVASDPLAGMAPWNSVDRLVASALTPAMRDLLDADPRPVLERLQIPTLVIGAEFDLQVDATTNLHAIEESLRRAGNPDYELVNLKGLNHLMQPAQTGLQDEYGSAGMAYAPEFLTTITTWLEKRFLQREITGKQKNEL